MGSTSPPAYSPPRRSPAYTAEPGSNETRIAVTSRRTRRSAPSRTFTWRNDSVTLSILGKEEGVASPIYGRSGVVSAEISINSDTVSIMSVAVQIQGVMKLSIRDTAYAEVPVFLRSYTLWSKPSGTPSSEMCPGTLLFEDILPLTYEDGGHMYDLPPTYKVQLPGPTGLDVDCSYSITVCVTKSSDSRLWRSHIRDKLMAEIVYRPRARAYRPILSSPFPFSSTIKAVPEEWRQIPSKMIPYPSQSHIEAIDCLLFIPAVLIYSLSDNIPVYLQLRGRVSSLRAFMHIPPPTSALSSLFRHSVTPQPPEQPTVSVFLSRQVTVSIQGQRATRLIKLGEANLRSIPPDVNLAMQEHDGLANLDYEGEVRCTQDETVGSFFTGQLLVKDHIVVHLVPSGTARSPLQEHRNSYPIRLVTEPFQEEPDIDT